MEEEVFLVFLEGSVSVRREAAASDEGSSLMSTGSTSSKDMIKIGAAVDAGTRERGSRF